MRSLWIVTAAVAVALPAGAADRPDHRVEGDVTIAARRVLQTHCAACHGDPDAKRRKGRFWVNDWRTMTGTAGDAAPPVPFVSTNPSNLRSQVLEFLQDGSMPPGGRPRPTPDEVKDVERWLKLADGAKPFPPVFDTDAVLQLIMKDPGRKAEDTKNVRYVSLAHLVDKPGADLGKTEAELARALGELLKGIDRPTADVFASAFMPVRGSAGTVFRLDLKQFRWHEREKNLFEVAREGQGRDEDFRMIPFDLIQLEYPYTHPPKASGLKAPVGELVAALNTHRKDDPLAQLRAVPFVYGDWLAAALMRKGQPTHLARDLEAVAKLGDALNAPGGQPRVGVGPEFAPFEGGPEVSDATAPSPWAWYQAKVSSADKEFTLRAGTDLPEGRLKPNGTLTLEAQSSRASVLTLIEVQYDRVRVLPLDSKWAEQEADKPKKVSPNEQGILAPVKLQKKGGFQYLLLASPKPSPPRPPREPVVVKSRHEQSAVWRVLPNAADVTDPDADPPPVARVVIPIDIKAID